MLIVVAIIAILAAIAVPSFLEAQVRVKVSRVKTDLRSIATAVEAYAVDRGDYPHNWSGGYQLLTPDLSTPIAYLSTVNIQDPFGAWMDPQHWHLHGYHRIVRLADTLQFDWDSPWYPDDTSIDDPLCNPGALRKYASGCFTRSALTASGGNPKATGYRTTFSTTRPTAR